METPTDMERLVHLLNEVNASDMTPRYYLEADHHSAVPLIKNLLCSEMITEEGHMNWDKRDELASYGFRLVPIEKDNWGWIVGAVVTDLGMITFG
jgi:hypothetical protein